MDIKRDFITSNSRVFDAESYPIRIITVGTLEQLYKAPDILIKAFAICVSSGLDLELVIVGDGRYRSQLERQVNSLGLQQRVWFTGKLPAGSYIRAELDLADLFILPSRQEGVPRAMIEAMSRALPCIGSTVGGVPELLHFDDLVPPNDAQLLAAKIEKVVRDPKHMMEMSARNLRKSLEYEEAMLRPQRRAFYHQLREVTANHILAGIHK